MTDSRGTSINYGTTEAIRDLFGSVIRPGRKVLDYGAGRFARNADWLRSRGIEVYAYDPFNGRDVLGWGLGEVTTRPPEGHFDVGFTSYVLNVVSEADEAEILARVSALCARHYHVVRNRDLLTAAARAFPAEPSDRLPDICRQGFETRRGFQRLPHLEDRGLRLLRTTTKFKVYVA